MEVAPEELPERDIPQQSSLNPFAQDSLWKNICSPDQQVDEHEPASQENVATAGEQRGDAGSQTLLAADAAVQNGDGVTAAGMGSTAAGGGSAATGGDTGHYEAGAAGIEEHAAAVPAPPAESEASIADRFAACVESHKEYPYMAVRRGQTGVVRVSVTLGTDGSLLAAGISSSSGVAVLDEAALQAVRSACPFSHRAGREITLTVPLHFELQ